MSDVNFRRTWPEKKSSTTSSSTSSTRKKEFTRPLYSTDTLKLLEARSKKVNFDAIVGKTQMVMAGTGAGAQAGFYCSLCDKLCKDNVAFLDHLNSPLHARNTGHKMEIKRATVESVKARLEYHKRKRLEVKEDYDLSKRVQLLKEQTDLQKQQRKAAKKEALLKKRIRQEDPESLNVPCSDPLQETSSSSEYSDYDIDEFGNIIETIKPPKPIRESSSFIKQQEQALEQEQHLMTQVLGFQSFGSTRK